MPYLVNKTSFSFVEGMEKTDLVIVQVSVELTINYISGTPKFEHFEDLAAESFDGYDPIGVIAAIPRTNDNIIFVSDPYIKYADGRYDICGTLASTGYSTQTAGTSVSATATVDFTILLKKHE